MRKLIEFHKKIGKIVNILSDGAFEWLIYFSLNLFIQLPLLGIAGPAQADWIGDFYVQAFLFVPFIT